MSLSLSLRRKLREILIERSRPLFLLVDDNYRPVAIEGDAEHFGFGRPPADRDLRESIPLLHGFELGAPFDLPMVETPNGRYAALSVIPHEGLTGFLFTDVSAEHAQLQARQQLTNDTRLFSIRQSHLVEELSQSKDKIERLHRDAVARNQTKSHFIARLSHELRAPLMSILAHADLFRDPDRAAGEVERSIGVIETSTAHLLAMVHNILDQAGIETGQIALRPAPCTPSALVAGVCAMFCEQARARGLQLHNRLHSDLPCVQVDATRLRQLLINLINNAIKYTERGFVAVDGSWNNGRLVLRVIDSGPGIDPDTRARLFEPFQRGRGVEAEHGLGLGLSISSELARLMGGGLQALQRDAGGSQFVLEVEAPPCARAPLRRAPPSTENLRLLLVDDAPDVRMLYARLLSKHGYQVTEAATDAQALAALTATEPHLIVTDLYLERADGAELARQLRTRGFSGGLLVWSGSSCDSDRARALDAGADAYLVKPVERPLLLATLGELAANRLSQEIPPRP